MKHPPLTINDSHKIDNKTILKSNLLPKLYMLSPDKNSPQIEGTTVTWTADALDEDGDSIVYKFFLNDKHMTDWSLNSSWIWETKEDEVGENNRIEVWIRDGKHVGSNGYDDNYIYPSFFAIEPKKLNPMSPAPMQPNNTIPVQPRNVTIFSPNHRQPGVPERNPSPTKNTPIVQSEESAPFTWIKILDGMGISVQQTIEGGYIVAGAINNINNAWLFKADSSGKKQWDRTLSRSGAATSVQQARDGGYIISVDYGYGLIKTDSSGNKEWEKSYGGSDDVAKSVQLTSLGGYIIAGTTFAYGAGSCDAWLIKTDANGIEIWNKTFGGSKSDYGESVQQTSDEGYILAGSTGSYGKGNLDAWLIKTDPYGNKLWDKTLGGSKNDLARSVQQTADGGYAIAGGTGSYSAGNGGAWLIKTDSNGIEMWNKTFGRWRVNSVQQTSDKGYILAGDTHSSSRTDKTDALLIKTDSHGNKLWDKTFSGSGNVVAESAQQTTDNGYIIAGFDGLKGWLIKTDPYGNI